MLLSHFSITPQYLLFLYRLRFLIVSMCNFAWEPFLALLYALEYKGKQKRKDNSRILKPMEKTQPVIGRSLLVTNPSTLTFIWDNCEHVLYIPLAVSNEIEPQLPIAEAPCFMNLALIWFFLSLTYYWYSLRSPPICPQILVSVSFEGILYLDRPL